MFLCQQSPAFDPQDVYSAGQPQTLGQGYILCMVPMAVPDMPEGSSWFTAPMQDPAGCQQQLGMPLPQAALDVSGSPQEPAPSHTLRVEASEFQPQMGFHQQGFTMVQLPYPQEASELQPRQLATELGHRTQAQANTNKSTFQETGLLHASLLPPTPGISLADPPAMRVRSEIRRRSDTSTFAALGLECPYPRMGPMASRVSMVAEAGNGWKQKPAANNMGCTTPSSSSSSGVASTGGSSSSTQQRQRREAADSGYTNPHATQRTSNGKKSSDKDTQSRQRTLQKKEDTPREEETLTLFTQEAFPSLGDAVPKSKTVPKGSAWGKGEKQPQDSTSNEEAASSCTPAAAATHVKQPDIMCKRSCQAHPQPQRQAATQPRKPLREAVKQSTLSVNVNASTLEVPAQVNSDKDVGVLPLWQATPNINTHQMQRITCSHSKQAPVVEVAEMPPAPTGDAECPTLTQCSIRTGPEKACELIARQVTSESQTAVQNPVVEAAKSLEGAQEETDVSTDDETSPTAHVASDPTEEESEDSCEEHSTASTLSARAPATADDDCSPSAIFLGSSEEVSMELICTPVTSLQDLLSYRSLASDVPPELERFIACDVNDTCHASTCQPSDAVDRSIFGTNMQSSQGEKSRIGTQKMQVQVREQMQLLTPSAGAYKPRLAASNSASCEMDLKRTVQSRLNKVCPENVDTIAQQLCDIEITSSEDLQLVIGLIFKKALSEPHYCETYADLVLAWKAVAPEFASDGEGKPMTFKVALLNTVQAEFEALPKVIAPSKEEAEMMDLEEIDYWVSQRKGRFLANMKFIGHLFLRQLLSTKVVSFVLKELTFCDDVDTLPEEHILECACELIAAVGCSLEASTVGKACLEHICSRLLDLKQQRGPNGRSPYSKRIQFSIQDLFELRHAGWAKKVFKATAKTKEAIRLEQERDERAKSRGQDVDGSERVLLGQRPQHVQHSKSK